MVLAVKHILIYLLFLMLVELASITSFFNLCVSTFTIITHQEVHVTPLANIYDPNWFLLLLREGMSRDDRLESLAPYITNPKLDNIFIWFITNRITGESQQQ